MGKNIYANFCPVGSLNPGTVSAFTGSVMVAEDGGATRGHIPFTNHFVSA